MCPCAGCAHINSDNLSTEANASRKALQKARYYDQ